MSIVSSLYIGASGLLSNSLELEVVGDNVANSNTIGFKGSRAAFADVLGDTIIGGNGQLGLGVRAQTVQKIFTQGSLTSTGIATDMAVQGPGLFVVEGPDGPLYTRNGQFTLNQDGHLTSLEGLRVQGYVADANGVVTPGTGLDDLQLADATSPPLATSNLVIHANLDSQATVLGVPFDATDPANTSNFSTTMTVYDSLGAAHDIDLHYVNLGGGTWEWHAVTDGANVDGGTPGVPFELGTGTLTFDGAGNLSAVAGNTITLDPTGVAPSQTITLDMGDPATGAVGITQFAAPSATSFLSQDGHTAGTLAGIKVDENGNVIGAFTNGETRTLAQVALADFPAPDELGRIGGNLYRAFADAGEPNIGAPGSGGRGTLVQGALEQSNVDLASELIRMIVVQRAFQANSKTLTTADQMAAELVQIKR